MPEDEVENQESLPAEPADAGGTPATDENNAANPETADPETADTSETADADAEQPDAADTAGQSDADEVVPLPDFSGMLSEAAKSSIDLLNDVELNIKIELGRTELTVEEILKLANGSVVELNKLAGDPVDVLVNDQLVAHGEVLVVNDNFCVRLNEIVAGVTEKVMQNGQ